MVPVDIIEAGPRHAVLSGNFEITERGFEDFPSDDLLGSQNISPQILGLYIGVPRTEAEPSSQAVDLTRVILFKKNLEKICRDRDELIEQIQITVRHEVGHHLGLSEEDLEKLGLA